MIDVGRVPMVRDCLANVLPNGEAVRECPLWIDVGMWLA
jgi:hypothetical protein